MKSTNRLTFWLAMLLVLFRVTALAQDAAGDWVGQLSGGFKVRIHIEKGNTAYSGYLTNPSGNRTFVVTHICAVGEGSLTKLEHFHFESTQGRVAKCVFS